jgi:hypothetical protein
MHFHLSCPLPKTSRQEQGQELILPLDKKGKFGSFTKMSRWPSSSGSDSSKTFIFHVILIVDAVSFPDVHVFSICWLADYSRSSSDRDDKSSTSWLLNSVVTKSGGIIGRCTYHSVL